MLKGPPVFVARTFYGELALRFAHPLAVPRPDSCPLGRQNNPNTIAPTVGTMKKVTAGIMRRNYFKWRADPSMTTFRRDTATETAPGRRGITQ